MGILDKVRSLLEKNRTTAPVSSPSASASATPSIQNERRRNKRVNARDETRVLIVDDSPTVIFALKRILQSAGYITFEALDTESGVHLARTEVPDLIFLDIIFPGANGFSALRTLRKDPVTTDIPIIMISGNEQATELFFGSRIGADDFMKKPFSRYEVFARIERLLDDNLVPRRVHFPASDSTGRAPL